MIKKSVSSFLVSSIVFLFPVLVRAQDLDPAFGGFGDIVTAMIGFIGTILLPLVFAIALVVFLYGMFVYFILGGGDEKKREDGKKLLVWGIAGFVLMVLVWGIVNLIAFSIRAGAGEPTYGGLNAKHTPGVVVPAD